jgi:hypothetical protein
MWLIPGWLFRHGGPRINLNKPFLRKTINGVLTYITLRQYREMLESGTGLSGEEQFEFGGCGCFI